MISTGRFLLVCFLWSLVNSSCASAPTPTTVILVRHAEKRLDQGRDPELTAEGSVRAEELARALRDVPLTAIYATGYRRTQATVAPVAQQKGLAVEVIDAEEPEAQARAALEAEGPVLIAGHSNTLGPIIEALGGGPIEAIEHEEYDGLYFVTVVPKNPGRVHLLRFGAPSDGPAASTPSP